MARLCHHHVSLKPVLPGAVVGKVVLAPDADGKISPIVTLSHLSNADRATLADFGLNAEVSASANLDDVK